MTTLTATRPFALAERALLLGAALAAALTVAAAMRGGRPAPRDARGAEATSATQDWARATALP